MFDQEFTHKDQSMDEETRQLLRDVREELKVMESQIQSEWGVSTDGPSEAFEALVRRIDVALGDELHPWGFSAGSNWKREHGWVPVNKDGEPAIPGAKAGSGKDEWWTLGPPPGWAADRKGDGE